MIVVLWAQPVLGTIEISPSFLGMYRKTMQIENALTTYAARYKLDPSLARAVVLQESGGNAALVSSAGARGYFQVMPATFRMLGVRTNIEAGIKYLGQLCRQFGREDYAIAAYNAGPGTIAKDRPLRLETLQYVINVGHYKSVLRLYEPEVRRQAQAVKLWKVRQGDSWSTIAQETSVPTPFLLLYNPFLASRPLQAGAVVAYPTTVPHNLLEWEEEELYYTSRIGDSYLNLALVFGVGLETFRRDNDLWRLQQLPVGMQLQVAIPQDSPFQRVQLVSPPAMVRTIALGVQPTRKSAPLPPPVATPARTHKVRRGDSLTTIARRYQTTVQALMRANSLRQSRIQAGTSLLIPGE
jgi:LysM repeat protein